MKKELIAKHLEDWHQPQLSSIEYFAKTGKATGGFAMALNKMLDEYAEHVVTNLLQSCVSGQLPLSEEQETNIIVAKNLELFKKLRDEASGNLR